MFERHADTAANCRMDSTFKVACTAPGLPKQHLQQNQPFEFQDKALCCLGLCC